MDDVLEGLERMVGPDGRTSFLLPSDIGAGEAQRIVMAAFVVNRGSSYGDHAEVNDFATTPFSTAEVERTRRRQRANAWSYRLLLPVVHRAGARIVATPNGIMMGLGGGRLRGLLSRRGGTMWGDLFLLSIVDVDPVAELRATVASGRARFQRDGRTFAGELPLVRLLHHEERHARQWARRGPVRFVVSYVWERARGRDDTEVEAGLRDGGYR